MIRRSVAILAALSLSLMVAAPALAISVAQSNVSWDDAEFQGDESECAGADLQPGQVLWHFVHVGTDASDLPSTLTATFDVAGTVTASGYVNGSSPVMYDIITGEDTFLSGSDNISTGGPLNLSHICSGGPGTEIPEAPASILLVLVAGMAAAGFVVWQMRRSSAVA